MFGYLRPFKPELKIREYESYKAVYCGLCREMGSSFGPLCRMTLSYDFTLMAMLHMSVTGKVPSFERQRCCCNPLKTVPMCAPGESLALSARVAVIMLYYKLVDNVADSGPIKSLLWRALYPLVKPAYKKAASLAPREDRLVAACMENQRELEARLCSSVDEASEPTAKAMAAIFQEFSEQPGQRRVLERMGYFMGRYVYLCDALDDIEQDQKSGGYNPFVLRAKAQSQSVEIPSICEEAQGSLYMTIAEIGRAFELLESSAFAPIIENVVTLGLKASVDAIVLKKENPNP
ncbi:DUF5685 family protein [Oscillospiraceae bacterium MB08-C2-2]|nr:DUF5685 family protein [Oscillospiraceae bacterium MB08-C2-2]